MPNRLAEATSPYLLQHKDNPVDWYPWGEEAFERARADDKPLLISIGYSACHWCHVMERESFENPQIAAAMNERYVCVKVDREERPDVDAIYMDALQAMTGHGGWPLNAFLRPDGVPFYAGTYYPPEPRQGMPSWTQVLEGVSHAWREQREEMASMADLLRMSPLRSEQHDMVRTLRSAGQTLLEMIGDLLDIAKIEAGTMTVQPAPFDLHALLATVRSLLCHQAANKGLELRLMVDPSVPYRLHGAARSLQQILVNLVANAVKFTHTGHVLLGVECLTPVAGTVPVIVSVVDTGIGIPTRALEALFEKFTQADTSTTRRYGGTGLGLAISKRLVELMDGRIWVESAEGQGSTFAFALHLPLSDEPEVVPVPAAALTSRSSTAST